RGHASSCGKFAPPSSGAVPARLPRGRQPPFLDEHLTHNTLHRCLLSPAATVTLQVQLRYCHACSLFPAATKNGTFTQRGPDSHGGSLPTECVLASTRSPVERFGQIGPRCHHFRS